MDFWIPAATRKLNTWIRRIRQAIMLASPNDPRITIRLVDIVETSAPLWVDIRILLALVFAAFHVKGAGPLKG